MKLIKLTALSAVALASTAAMAGTTSTVVDGGRVIFKAFTNPAAVSAEVGSLGYGANVAWAVNDTVELQAGWAGGDAAKMINDNFDANGVNYAVTTDLSNPYLGLQLRPAANWFTVGTGIIVPNNDVKVKANSSNGTYRIGGVNHKASEVGTLEGTLEHRNSLAPYMTVGFRPNISNKWGVYGELGAAYLGKTDATVTAKGDGTKMTKAEAQKLADQVERDIEAKDYAEWYPIAKVGVTYRF